MLVSIVMPTYNCGKYITKSIDSILVQTMSDWELQIVDDCSTDNTQGILVPYLEQYPQIHYSKLPYNGGPAAARTEAIRRANGKYIAFLDSDDLWVPRKLEKQISFMKEINVPFSCTAYACMDNEGKSLHYAFYPPERIDYQKCILLSNPIGNLTTMYDQEVLGKFEVPLIKKRNDFALWLQLLKKTHYCAGLQEILGHYRTGRKDSVSSNKLKQGKYHWQLYHDIEQHNFFRSLFEISCWIFVKGTHMGLDKRNL